MRKYLYLGLTDENDRPMYQITVKLLHRDDASDWLSSVILGDVKKNLPSALSWYCHDKGHWK